MKRIIAEIDGQISKLQQARQLLAGGDATVRRTGPGRPKGSKNGSSSPHEVAPGRRNLTPEGRKRIADAMKRRWAERKKTSTNA